jgi:sensor histidine kinase YesM
METRGEQKEYKRQLRSVLIHKPMQREFTLVVMSLLIISALTIGFVIHATIREAMMGGGYQFGRVSAYELMSEVRYDLIVRVSLILFVTVLVIAAFGVFFLHRVAGPVYRFRSILRQVSKGEIPGEFRLREGDYFTETADDLNRVLRVLRERRDRAQTLRERLDQAIQENAGLPVVSLLRELRENLEEKL